MRNSGMKKMVPSRPSSAQSKTGKQNLTGNNTMLPSTGKTGQSLQGLNVHG